MKLLSLPVLCSVLLGAAVFAQSDSLSRSGVSIGGKSSGGTAQATVMYAGKYYRDAQIQSFGEQAVTIYSPKDGKAEVPVSALPAAMKAEVAAWKRQMAKQAEEAKPTPQGQLWGTVRVIQRLKDGLLCSFGSQNLKLIGHPRETDIVDGEEVSVRAMPAGTFQYTTALGSLATVRVYRVTEAK